MTPRWATELAPGGASVYFVARECDNGEPLDYLNSGFIEIFDEGQAVGTKGDMRRKSRHHLRPYMTIVVDATPEIVASSEDVVDAIQDLLRVLMDDSQLLRPHVGLQLLGGPQGQTMIERLPVRDREGLLEQADALFDGAKDWGDDEHWAGADLDEVIPATITDLQAHLRQVHDRNFGGVIPVGHVIVLSTDDTDGLSPATRQFIDDQRQGATALPQTPSVDTWPVEVNNPSQLSSDLRRVATAIVDEYSASYIYTFCPESRGGEATIQVVVRGQNHGAASFAIDTTDAADDCSGEFFDTNCDDRECGGVHCGGCSDTTEICADGDVGECIDYCLAAVACEEQIIMTDLGHSLECSMGPTMAACDGQCVDIFADPDHCGQCDNPCTSDQFCDDGRCTCLDDELQICGADAPCVDITSDDDHCGQCGNSCPIGQTCSDGSCT